MVNNLRTIGAVEKKVFLLLHPGVGIRTLYKLLLAGEYWSFTTVQSRELHNIHI